jgi:hypothetical protein
MEERIVVLPDHFDQQVIRPGRDDQVLDLGQGVDDPGGLQELGRFAAHPDHRLQLEAEPERVGDADDLEDAACDEAIGARTHRCFPDAEDCRDLREGAAAVLLEMLRGLWARAAARGGRDQASGRRRN